MSLDLAMFTEFDGISLERIKNGLDRIDAGQSSPFGEPSDQLKAFAADIWAIYPPLSSIDDTDPKALKCCPWAVDFDLVDGFIYMCMKWNAVTDEFVSNINKTVNKHKLYCYDPQNDVLHDNKPAAK